MIFIADLNMIRRGHIAFNTAFIKILRQCFPEQTIEYYSECNQLFEIRNQLSDVNIKYEKRFFITDGKRWYIFLKEMIEFLNWIRIYRRACQKKVEYIFLLSTFPLNHLMIKVFRKIFPGIPLVMVLHGELEWMREKKRKNLYFFGKCLNLSLKMKPDSKQYYLVLGRIIKKNLLSYMPELKKYEQKILTMDHPYIYDNIPTFFELQDVIKFSAIGEALIRKNSQFIFQLAAKFQKESRVKFSIIGRLTDEVKDYDNGLVEYTDTKVMLSDRDFKERIQSTDYTLYFYDNTQYKMCASGAMFDSVKFIRPMIAIENDYFAYYFNRFGNIGYLCKSYKELEEKIQWILKNHPKKEYKTQCKNLIVMRNKLSIKHIGETFSNVFKNIS